MTPRPDTPDTPDQPDTPARPADQASSGSTAPARRRRRWWQRALRWTALGVLICLGAYVTLPWWLRGEWLADRLAAQLSRQAQTRVEVDDVRLSWADGVHVEGIRLYAGTGPAAPLLAELAAAQTELAPLEMLADGQLDWLQLVRPRLYLRLDQPAGPDLAPLRRLMQGPPPDRMTIQRGQLWLISGEADPAIRFDLTDMQILAGHAEALGRITLSARLAQAPTPAPLALRATAGLRDEPAPAAATVRFAGVDLAQLHLPKLLGLPVSRLAGTLSGNVSVRANRQAVVETFRLQLTVNDLDVQPRAGGPLPVIANAGLAMAASWDPIADRLDISDARLRLPGMDLAGRAVAVGNIRNGPIEALREIRLSGQIRPDRLLPVLTGRSPGPEDTRLTGPVLVDLRATHEGPRLGVEISADATDATLRSAGRTLKPLGRRLSLAGAGTIDDRSGQLDANRLTVALGANRLTGRAHLPNLQRLIALAQPQIRPTTPAGVLDRLAGARLTARFHLAQPDELAAWHPLLAAALAQVRLDEPIEGQVALAGATQGRGPRLNASLRAQPGAGLGVGEWFSQPSDQALTISEMTVAWTARPGDPGRAALTAQVGSTRLSLTEVLFVQPVAAPGDLRIGGRWSVSGAEGLQPWLPGPDRRQPAGWPIAGDAEGQFALSAAMGEPWPVRRALAEADLTRARLSPPGPVRKPAGDPMRLVGQLDRSETGEWVLAAHGASDAMTGRARVVFPPRADPPDRQGEADGPDLRMGRGELSLRIADAAKSRRMIVQADRLLGASMVAGSAELTAAARWHLPHAPHPGATQPPVEAGRQRADLPGGGLAGLTGRVSLAGDDLSILLAGPSPRRKPPGAAFRLHATARAEPVSGEDPHRHWLGRATLRTRLGDANARIALIGRPGPLDLATAAERGAAGLLDAIARAEFDANAPVADYAILSALPEWRQAVMRHGLTGSLAIDANYRRDAAGRHLHARADLSRFGAGPLGPWTRPGHRSAGRRWALLAALAAPHPDETPAAPDDALGAPYETPAAVDDATAAPDETTPARRPADGDAGQDTGAGGAPTDHADPDGDGDAKTDANADILPAVTLPVGLGDSLRVTLRTGPRDRDLTGSAELTLDGARLDATATARLTRPPTGAVPELTPRSATLTAEIAGRTLAHLVPATRAHEPAGRASLRAAWDAADANALHHVHADLAEVGFRRLGKPVGLDGSLAIGRVPLTGPLAGVPSSVRTDRLGIDLPGAAGWVIADVDSIHAQPAGRIDVLLTRGDDKRLVDWLTGRAGDAPPPPRELTDVQRFDLRDGVDRFLRRGGRSLLRRLDLAVRLQAERFVSFDPTVGESYRVNGLDLDLSASDGRLALRYFAGLNGGILRDRYTVDLNGADPNVQIDTAMRDVIASTEIQPQMAKYFPGNNVEGYFNRWETSEAPLVDFLANLLDPRYPLRPAGRAKTVAVEGYIVGKAGPDWLARVFPDLNMSRYHYERMTGFAELHADGSADNDMIYRGEDYDVYMEGSTSTEGIARYEIGLLLTMGSATWHHEYKQGRIPLMNFTGRIAGGQMHDEQVELLWPNQSLFVMFLKNNFFYQSWKRSRQEPASQAREDASSRAPRRDGTGR